MDTDVQTPATPPTDETPVTPQPKPTLFGHLRQFFRNARLDPFPLRRTLRHYTFAKAKADAKAAANVALLDFPQGMAYALIAGLPVQHGIYCSAIASCAGPALASSRFVMLGPTNATAVLLLSAMLALNIPDTEKLFALPLLLLMVGMFMILGAFLRVANLVQYISRSVITGYITAAAALIIVNQVKHALGFETPRAAAFFENLGYTLSGLAHTHLPSAFLSAVTLLIYLVCRRCFKTFPNVAIALASGSLVAWGLTQFDLRVDMLSPIAPGSWAVSLPHFDFGLFASLANAALAIALLAILESSSIAKTLAARSGDRVDVNQQMLSIGVCNLINAFGSGMAVSGSLTRSVLNWSSGAQTAISSLISGALLIAGVLLLGPYIGYIPKPSLAVLVILVGVSLVNREQIRVMLKATKSDCTVFLVTFLGGLLVPLDTAIYLGTGASIILFLKKASQPQLVEIAFNDRGELSERTHEPGKDEAPEISIVHVEGELFFGSTEIFLDQTRIIVEDPNLKIIVLRMRNAHHLDASAAMAIGELVRFARESGRDVIISGAHDEVERVFRNSGLMDILGEKNFFRLIPQNPNISTRNALKRAQEILGANAKPNIVIFAKPKAPDAPASGT